MAAINFLNSACVCSKYGTLYSPIMASATSQYIITVFYVLAAAMIIALFFFTRVPCLFLYISASSFFNDCPALPALGASHRGQASRYSIGRYMIWHSPASSRALHSSPQFLFQPSPEKAWRRRILINFIVGARQCRIAACRVRLINGAREWRGIIRVFSA